MATLDPIRQASAGSRKPHLIFVHGLGGHPRDTWTHDTSNPEAFWPAWVGEDLDCSVWSLGYDAALSGWQSNAMPLPDQGTTVLDLLQGEPRLKNVDLVLIGHSMGGLVIKTAIQNATTLGLTQYALFPRRIRGVVFIATPHFGSELASLAVALKALARTNDQVSDLRQHDAHLKTLNLQFREAQRVLKFDVRSYSEGSDVVLPRRLLGLRSPGVRIVKTADPHVERQTAVALDEDHFSICKPKARDAQIHISLLAFARSLIEHDAICATLGGCKISIIIGRIEEQTIAPGALIALPCNEYFEEQCVEDVRSALGAYALSRFGDRRNEFAAEITAQRKTLGTPVLQEQTPGRKVESFGTGKCLLLKAPQLGVPAVALLSTATQRSGEGLVSRISDLFPAIAALSSGMADTRANEVVMPLLGAGHGGLRATEALSGLLLAIAQEARRPSSHLKKATIVVYRGAPDSTPQLDRWQIRSILSAVTEDTQ